MNWQPVRLAEILITTHMLFAQPQAEPPRPKLPAEALAALEAQHDCPCGDDCQCPPGVCPNCPAPIAKPMTQQRAKEIQAEINQLKQEIQALKQPIRQPVTSSTTPRPDYFYPTRSKHWSIGSIPASQASESLVRAHLQDDGNHRRFPNDFLMGLDREELLSLHDDDHTGTVRWDIINGQIGTQPVTRPATVQPRVIYPYPQYQPIFQPVYQNCPNGICPQIRYRND